MLLSAWESSTSKPFEDWWDIVLRIKVLAAKLGSLSLIPMTHMVEGETSNCTDTHILSLHPLPSSSPFPQWAVNQRATEQTVT